ncbi:MAG: hypothetical protein RIE73_06725 [Coleofasciculus sp. C1-SOL-03]|uniref:hypothetical protein n=1 Tax=Coleofasciculus sp. C1-SOL-03 TaxID=3069522 RepID=UPI0032F81F04
MPSVGEESGGEKSTWFRILFLEGESQGKADPVEASELADLLTGKGIPVCILNACQSGKQISASLTLTPPPC